jgi:hypothetical protein
VVPSNWDSSFACSKPSYRTIKTFPSWREVADSERMAPAVLRGEEREAPARGEARSEAAAGRTARVTERKKTIVKNVRSRKDMGRGKEGCRRGDARPVINKKKRRGATLELASPAVGQLWRKCTRSMRSFVRSSGSIASRCPPCLRLPKFGIWNQVILC